MHSAFSRNSRRTRRPVYINTVFRTLIRTTRLLHFKGIRNQTRRFRLPARSAITCVYRFRALDSTVNRNDREITADKNGPYRFFICSGDTPGHRVVTLSSQISIAENVFFLPIHCRFSYRLVGGGGCRSLSRSRELASPESRLKTAQTIC